MIRARHLRCSSEVIPFPADCAQEKKENTKIQLLVALAYMRHCVTGNDGE